MAKFIFLVVLLGAVFYIGWFGLSWPDYISSGLTCRSSYVHYAIKPIIHDWWQCRRQTPCGVDEKLDRYDAAVKVMQCLCADRIDKDDQISTLYEKEIRSMVPVASAHPDSITICNVSQPRLRL